MAYGTPWDVLNVTDGALGVYGRTLPNTGRMTEVIPYKDVRKVTFDIESYDLPDLLDVTSLPPIKIDYTAIERRILSRMLEECATVTGTTSTPKSLTLEDIMESMKQVCAVDAQEYAGNPFDFPVYGRFYEDRA